MESKAADSVIPAAVEDVDLYTTTLYPGGFASVLVVLSDAIIYFGEIKLTCWSDSINWSEDTLPPGVAGSEVVK